MDNNELRTQMIDDIVKFIYPEGRHINDQYLLRHIMNQYKPILGEGEWSVFYSSLLNDISYGSENNILVKQGSLIGLTDLGREMGKAGGYIKYNEKAKRQEKRTRFWDNTEKIAVIVSPIITIICSYIYIELDNITLSKSTFFFSTFSFFFGLTINSLFKFLKRLGTNDNT